jgi:sugar phosphate isomerase/epimerase
LCIEALGAEETEFITSVSEAIDLVRGVNHEFFRLQIDTKCLFSTGESLEKLLESGGDLLRHFHVSDPGLAPPGSTGASHAPFGAALREYKYQDYVSIEMRRGIDGSLKTLSESVAVVRHDYLGGQSFG